MGPARDLWLALLNQLMPIISNKARVSRFAREGDFPFSSSIQKLPVRTLIVADRASSQRIRPGDRQPFQQVRSSRSILKRNLLYVDIILSQAAREQISYRHAYAVVRSYCNVRMRTIIGI